MHGKGFIDVDIGKTTFVGAYDSVILACKECLNSKITHLGCVDPVTTGGNATTLDVTVIIEDDIPSIESVELSDIAEDSSSISGTVAEHIAKGADAEGIVLPAASWNVIRLSK